VWLSSMIRILPRVMYIRTVGDHFLLTHVRPSSYFSWWLTCDVWHDATEIVQWDFSILDHVCGKLRRRRSVTEPWTKLTQAWQGHFS
jgi:hypothetical protein